MNTPNETKLPPQRPMTPDERASLDAFMNVQPVDAGAALPWNSDAPKGQAWKCPDCESWATLGGNAAYHAKKLRHGMPSLVPLEVQWCRNDGGEIETFEEPVARVTTGGLDYSPGLVDSLRADLAEAKAALELSKQQLTNDSKVLLLRAQLSAVREAGEALRRVVGESLCVIHGVTVAPNLERDMRAALAAWEDLNAHQRCAAFLLVHNINPTK